MVYRTNPPTLHDGELLLRPWQAEFADALVEAVQESIGTVGRWLPWCHAGYGLAEAHQWVATCEAGAAAGTLFSFAIFDARNDQLLGGVGLNQIPPEGDWANLGYWIRSSRQGQGIASRAARLVARFGFEQRHFPRIGLAVLPDNLRSRRTAEKLGARLVRMGPTRLSSGESAPLAAIYDLTPGDLRDSPGTT